MSNVSDTVSDREIRDFMERTFQVVRQNDASGLEGVFSDDYDLVTQTGMHLSKRQLVDLYRSGEMKQDELEVSDVTVRNYGSTAIVRAVYRSVAKFSGNPIDVTFARIDVLVRQEDRWKIVASQASEATDS